MAPRKALKKKMAEQSLLAIEEADVVLFLVDARAGLVPADVGIAQYLRQREKNDCFGSKQNGWY